MKSKAEIARKAREAIEGRWYQGDYADGEGGRFCTLGGLAVALGQVDGDFDNVSEHPFAGDLKKCIEDIIAQQYPDFVNNHSGWTSLIADWNDAEGRTEDEVLAVLDKATLRLEEEGI